VYINYKKQPDMWRVDMILSK